VPAAVVRAVHEQSARTALAHLGEGDFLLAGRQVLVRWLGFFLLIGEAKLAPQLAPNSIKWAGTTGHQQNRTPRKLQQNKIVRDNQ